MVILGPHVVVQVAKCMFTHFKELSNLGTEHKSERKTQKHNNRIKQFFFYSKVTFKTRSIFVLVYVQI